MLTTYGDINSAWGEKPVKHTHLSVGNLGYKSPANHVCDTCESVSRTANGNLLMLLNQGNPVGTFCTFGEDTTLRGYHRAMQYPIKLFPNREDADFLPFSCPKDIDT